MHVEIAVSSLSHKYDAHQATNQLCQKSGNRMQLIRYARNDITAKAPVRDSKAYPGSMLFLTNKLKGRGAILQKSRRVDVFNCISGLDPFSESYRVCVLEFGWTSWSHRSYNACCVFFLLRVPNEMNLMCRHSLKATMSCYCEPLIFKIPCLVLDLLP